MRAIIGPNGAGKTTMMDIITGKTRPDEGAVVFDNGTDLTTKDEADRPARHRPQVPEADGVREPHRRGQPDAGARRPTQRAAQPAVARQRGAPRGGSTRSSAPSALTAQRQRLAGSLSHGQKQWLEIGMLLAQDPQLLLVDEPVAGMTDAETRRTAELLREIARTHSVVVIEHDMEFVRALGVQGHGAARGLGAGRGLDRPGQRPTARDRGLSGALTMLEGRAPPWSPRSTAGGPRDRSVRAAQALRHVSVTAEPASHLHARPQRRRQDSLLAPSSASSRSAAGDPVRGAGHHPPQAYERARRGIAYGAAGPRDLPAADGAREPRDRLRAACRAASAGSRTRCSSCSRC